MLNNLNSRTDRSRTDRKLLIEKEARLMEELILNYLLTKNDKKFFDDSRILSISLYHKILFNKIFIFIHKFKEQPLLNILSSEVLNMYDRNVIDEILIRTGSCNPHLVLKRIVYLNGLLFVRNRVDDAMYKCDFEAEEEESFSASIKCISKDFESIFDSVDHDGVIDSSNIELKFDQVFQREEKVLVSGLHYLDVVTNGGFNAGDLIICAARPGIGKTTFGVNLIVNNLHSFIESGKTILCVTPDMSPKYLYYRLVACAYDIDINEVLTFEKEKMLNYLKKFPIKVIETYLYEKIEECLKINAGNISVVIIDYIQAIRSMNIQLKSLSRNEQLGIITLGLKKLAKKYGITLIFLAQLNRESEMSGGKAWIRDSGYLEQEADLVLIIDQDRSYRYPRLLFEITKNRHGGLGSFHHSLNSSRFRIE